jgi:hypothetical protein
MRGDERVRNWIHGIGEKISLKLAGTVLKGKMSFLYYDV